MSSFVLDQIHRIDVQLDRLQLAPTTSPQAAIEPASTDDAAQEHPSTRGSARPSSRPQTPSPRVLALQAAIRSISTGGSQNRTLLKVKQIQSALATLSPQPEVAAIAKAQQAGIELDDQSEQAEVAEDNEAEKDPYEQELEWLLVSKATTQVYGTVLKTILDNAVDIANDIWYWDAILSSRTGTLIYSVQISPLRLWHWGGTILNDVKARGGRFSVTGAREDAGDTLSKRWRQFYSLVRDVVKERSVLEVRRQMLSPITRVRTDIRTKQAALRKIRVRNANALGVLLGEGLVNECIHGDGIASPMPRNVQDVHLKWKASVGRNVALMEAVLAKTTDIETPVDGFDVAIAELTDDDPLYVTQTNDLRASPQDIAERLGRLLSLGLSHYSTATKMQVRQHGKPSRLVRYWLPLTIGILSSSTILRIVANRKAELVQWVSDLGRTVVDFWTNWVLEPTKNLIKTIRHDEGSAISIMSKRSLEGDRESLERMVVDFAIDNPSNATGSNARMTDSDIADLRAKVREGDLTPVLRAYEKDLASPVIGALRGNLIRALLIQIQKTKVDVEVAMGGIDSLLKSQELLIGFISLTPGLLVAYGLARYLRSSSLLTSRRNSAALKKQGLMLRQLRNIDRILSRAHPTEFGELLYKDQGLLICEAHVLRQAAAQVMPAEILKEFGEEVEELCDVRVGVERQRRVEDRIRWAYRKWLN